MLYFVSAELTIGYLIFAFCSALGALQAVAARYHLDGMALLDYREHPFRGYVLAVSLTLVSGAAFLITQWAPIFAPGPAGSELVVLFGGATLAALGATAAAASLRLARQRLPSLTHSEDWSAVTIGSTPGRLYAPANPSKPLPALCIIPNPGDPWRTLQPLARQLCADGFVTLALSSDRQAYSYPCALALLPAALSFLRKRPDVDPLRLGVVGYDLGADLAIRAASADKQVQTVVALAPVLEEPLASLDLLREMTYLQALRRVHDRQRRRFLREVDAASYVLKIEPRPLLLVYGSEDAIVSLPSSPVVAVHNCTRIAGAGHFDLTAHARTLAVVGQWLKERL